MKFYVTATTRVINLVMTKDVLQTINLSFLLFVSIFALDVPRLNPKIDTLLIPPQQLTNINRQICSYTTPWFAYVLSAVILAIVISAITVFLWMFLKHFGSFKELKKKTIVFVRKDMNNVILIGAVTIMSLGGLLCLFFLPSGVVHLMPKMKCRELVSNTIIFPNDLGDEEAIAFDKADETHTWLSTVCHSALMNSAGHVWEISGGIQVNCTNIPVLITNEIGSDWHSWCFAEAKRITDCPPESMACKVSVITKGDWPNCFLGSRYTSHTRWIKGSMETWSNCFVDKVDVKLSRDNQTIIPEVSLAIDPRISWPYGWLESKSGYRVIKESYMLSSDLSRITTGMTPEEKLDLHTLSLPHQSAAAMAPLGGVRLTAQTVPCQLLLKIKGSFSEFLTDCMYVEAFKNQYNILSVKSNVSCRLKVDKGIGVVYVKLQSSTWTTVNFPVLWDCVKHNNTHFECGKPMTEIKVDVVEDLDTLPPIDEDDGNGLYVFDETSSFLGAVKETLLWGVLAFIVLGFVYLIYTIFSRFSAKKSS